MQKAIDKHVILMMGLLFLLNRSLTYGPVVTFLAALISMKKRLPFMGSWWFMCWRAFLHQV